MRLLVAVAMKRTVKALRRKETLARAGHAWRLAARTALRRMLTP